MCSMDEPWWTLLSESSAQDRFYLFADVDGIVPKIHKSRRHLKWPMTQLQHLTGNPGKSMPKQRCKFCIVQWPVLLCYFWTKWKTHRWHSISPSSACLLMSLHHIASNMSATFLQHHAWLQTNMLRQRTFASGTHGIAIVKVKDWHCCLSKAHQYAPSFNRSCRRTNLISSSWSPQFNRKRHCGAVCKFARTFGVFLIVLQALP